jgi:hypothetical protein
VRDKSYESKNKSERENDQEIDDSCHDLFGKIKNLNR